MISDDDLRRLMPKFPSYSSAQIQAHVAYYRSCDPLYFLRLAAQFELPAYVTDNSDEGGFDLLPDNAERFEATKASFLRYTRYLSAERLILLLVSGYPLGPAPRTFTLTNNNRLAALLVTLSEARIPDELSIRASGRQLTFQEWIGQLVFHKTETNPEFVESLSEFFPKLASFVVNREVINAFKHGRAQTPISGQPFQMSVGTGEAKQSMLKNMEGAVHWMGWAEQSSPQVVKHTIKLGFEETNANSDYEMVKLLAALEKLIVDVRRGYCSEDQTVEVFLPDLHIETSKHYPGRMLLQFDTTWDPKRKVKE